ncbi:MAG: hypothetical protein M3Z37_10360 [Candidatus Eremiobacteraeota bacterium]|nr:hypothetical protein [Candidatus Eremiobacteraeota bacterium]
MLCFVGIGLQLLPTQAVADEEPQRTDVLMDVRADQLRYYADENMIEARGAVQLKLSNNVQVRGDACVINIPLQRFVVAGHVVLETPAGHFSGAAMADFLAFKRVYFIPLDDAPDRWTFLNDDYAHPEKGRQMPGDAFFLPDFSDIHPFITGKEVHIDPNNYVQFTPARFIVLNGLLSAPRLPTYVRNFSANQNFSVNSLSGATFDIPYGIAGSSHSLETLHFRYDQQRKTYGAFEHHSVFGDHGYVVMSLNPATQPAKQWNLLSYGGGATGALVVNAQLFTYQYGLSQPLSSSGFLDLQGTRALSGSSFRLEVTQSYDSLLAPPALGYYGDPSHTFVPNHPLVLGASWFGYDKRVGNSGLSFRLTSGVSFMHDAFGVVNGKKDAMSEYTGGLFYTPVYPAPFGTGINASYVAQRTWLSFPNKVDVQTLTVTDSKRFSNKLAVTGSWIAQLVYVDDMTRLYASPSTTIGLTPQPVSPNGLPIIGGVATQFPNVRNSAYILTAAWSPSTNFQLTASAQENHYGPVQAPFVAGPARFQVAGGVRTRLSKTLFLDVGRIYYFNWANQPWSPRFNLQVSAQ